MPEKLRRWLNVEGGEVGIASTRDKVFRRLVHDAEVVNELLLWVDKINHDKAFAKATEDQVFAELNKHAERALSLIPQVSKDKADEYLRLRFELDKRAAEITQPDSEQADILSSPEFIEDELMSEYEQRLYALDAHSDPDSLAVLHIRAWTDSMRETWKRINAYQGNTSAALTDLNELLKQRHDRPLDPDKVKVDFTPFCVFVTIEEDVKIKTRFEKFGGLSIKHTPFAIVRRSSSSGASVHELGHKLLDALDKLPDPGIANRLMDRCLRLAQLKADSSQLSNPLNPLAYHRRRLEHDMRQGCLDWLRNEILAEMNSKRRGEASNLDFTSRSVGDTFDTDLWEDYGDWKTAEQDAKKTLPQFFKKTLIPELRSIDEPDLAAKAEELTNHTAKRFKKIKQSLNRALELAIFLPDGYRFTAAAAVVTPVRLMHHLPDVLRAKFGETAFEAAENEVKRLALTDSETPDAV